MWATGRPVQCQNPGSGVQRATQTKDLQTGLKRRRRWRKQEVDSRGKEEGGNDGNYGNVGNDDNDMPSPPQICFLKPWPWWFG
jgi:hypothetical protein